DLQAVEFVAGVGGSKDYLLQPNTFAIIPGLQFGTFDTQLGAAKGLRFTSATGAASIYDADRNIYDSVYLSGGAGLPAGNYALLPGYYALLPGAYIVRPQTSAKYQDMRVGQVASLSDGTAVVAGYGTVAGTGMRESRLTGFAVQPGAEAL